MTQHVKSAGELSVADVGEAGLLARLARRLGRQDADVWVGVGDDAALLRGLGPAAVVCTDLIIEGVDFDRAWAGPRDIGHKVAAVNLSDLAAMGARPRGLLLALTLQPTDRVADVMALVGAVDRVGRRFGAPLIGGDLSGTPGPLTAVVTAFGEVKPERALRRYRARIGDQVLVSGRLGGAAAGLAILQGKARGAAALRRRQLRPVPRVELGIALARWGRVHGCADISDGLGRDALHLVPARSGVEIDVARLPLAPGVQRVAAVQGRAGWELALGGGEDFELAIAVAPGDVAGARRVGHKLGLALTPVGRVVARRGVHLAGTDRKAPLGFDHFAAGRGA